MLQVVFVAIVVAIVAAIAALVLNRRARAKKGLPPGSRLPIGLLVVLLVFCFIIAGFVDVAGGLPLYYMPSAAMEPTIKINDQVLVDKKAYTTSHPKPGDIVLLKPPPSARVPERSQKDTVFIKRVIAGPGDEFYILPGYVTVNGRIVDRTHLRTILASADTASPINLPMWHARGTGDEKVVRTVTTALLKGDPQWQSDTYTAGGIPIKMGGGGPAVKITRDGIYVNGTKMDHATLVEHFGRARLVVHPGGVVRNGKLLDEPYVLEDGDQAYPIEWGVPFRGYTEEMASESVRQGVQYHTMQLIKDGGHLRVKLMPDHYFVMGDNRNDSADSRMWGPIEGHSIIGRVKTIVSRSGFRSLE